MMRLDGRDAGALRPVRMERHYIKHHPGSVLVSFGDTKVLCTALMEEKVPPWMRGSGKGWVTAEYSMLPGAGLERTSREASRKGRAQEISRLIGRSLRAVTDLPALGECMITIDCDVIQADGGTRTAAITGGYVALYDALNASVQAGRIPRLPLHGACAAVSVGLCDGQPLLDLNYEEDVRVDVDFNVVMGEGGGIIEIQGCAEKALFSRTELNDMLLLAENGAARLMAMQRQTLGLPV